MPEDVAVVTIDRDTVYRMARRGELPAFKVSSRWRFLPSRLQRWMEEQGGRPASPSVGRAVRSGGPPGLVPERPVAAASEPRVAVVVSPARRGSVRVVWRAKGAMWVMKYRLPDGTESQANPRPRAGSSAIPRSRGMAAQARPPAGRDAQRRCRPQRATACFSTSRRSAHRCARDSSSAASTASWTAARCRPLADHNADLRPDRGEIRARWEGWRFVDVDADELEDYRDELAERGLAGSTLNQRRAVLSGIFKRRPARLPRQRRPDRRLRARPGPRPPATSTSTASRRCGRSCVRPPPVRITPASARTRAPPDRPQGAHARAAVYA